MLLRFQPPIRGLLPGEIDFEPPAPSPLIAQRARGKRFAMTAEEQILWRALSAKKLGVAFRRQVPLGRFIADFLAPAVCLAVEVDGGWHERRRGADQRRDAWLARRGI